MLSYLSTLLSLFINSLFINIHKYVIALLPNMDCQRELIRGAKAIWSGLVVISHGLIFKIFVISWMTKLENACDYRSANSVTIEV